MKKKFPVKKIITWVVIAGVLGGGGYFTWKHFSKPKVASATNTAMADIGTVEVSISGSGQIEPNDQYEVTALVKGEILDAPFEEGVIVSQGTLLYKINSGEAEKSIEKAELQLQKSQDSYNQNLDNVSKLTITVPCSGTITNFTVKNGDTVKSGAKIADVTDSSKMILSVPFIKDDVSNISTGMSAKITLDSSGYELTGTVSKLTTGSSVSSEGVEVSTVEITVNNPGSIKKDDKATAIVNDTACNDSGVFDYYQTASITAEIEGKAIYVPYNNNDYIAKGAAILKMSSDSLTNTLKSNELDIKNQRLSLETEREKLDDYNITSPINGTVIQKNSKKGDTLDSSTTKTVMATIADMSKIVFKMSVDELDIDKIQVGQNVTVTADALPDKQFEGVIEYKSIIGSSTNGVTSYPVTVEVLNPEGLIPGMNVDAKIIIESKDNVIRIPVSALKRGNIVQVKLKDGEKAADPAAPNAGENANRGQRGGNAPEGAGVPASTNTEGAPQRTEGGNAQRRTEGGAPQVAAGNGSANGQSGGAVNRMQALKAPDGFKNVMVKVGLNDKDYVEVTEGISPGDEVAVTAASAGSPAMNFQMGGMGGGMPGGGMGNRMPSGSGGAVRIETRGGG